MWRQNLCQGLDLDKDLNSADVDDKGAWSSIHDENIREEIQRDVSPVSFRRRSYQSFENAKTSDLLNERHMITDIIFCIENKKKIKKRLQGRTQYEAGCTCASIGCCY